MHVQLYAPPRGAGGLPVTRNMPYIQTSMPMQSQPRNMTGIYLGLEGNINPPRPKTGVPPLARTRGSSRMRTPIEEQRYRKVELLRIKEEKRGFSGNPVKRHQQTTTVPIEASCAQSAHTGDTQMPVAGGDVFHNRRWGPGKRIDPSNLDDLLRPNPRNFTTVANSGVTRSEKLTGWLGSLVPSDSGNELGGVGMARELGNINSDDLAGLEECFRKVCKGNVEALYSLLPGRKNQSVRRQHTGFTVRSYRNPNQAEILADFSSRGLGVGRADRPQTVPVRRPLVPQPYFYRHHAVTNRRLMASITHDAGSSTVSRILASPGAGSISRPLTQRLHSAATVIPTRSVTHLPRHPPSPTGHPEETNVKDEAAGETSSGTLQHSEDAVLTETWQGAAGDGSLSAAEAIVPDRGVRVAVVPSGHHLDSTIDSSTTLDDSVTPRPAPDSLLLSDRSSHRTVEGADGTDSPPAQDVLCQQGDGDTRNNTMDTSSQDRADIAVTQVKVEEQEDQTASCTEAQRARPKLTASNSGADIMLGLETDEGQSAEVEIDTADQDELLPEAEAPKGRVRKASITEKVIKTKASEAMAAMIKEEAESRQKQFEKLLDEHAELVQEISRTPSSENLIQEERDH